MSLITIKIEKVVIESNSELLEQINSKLDQLLGSEQLKKEIFDKLTASIEDIKKTV